MGKEREKIKVTKKNDRLIFELKFNELPEDQHSNSMMGIIALFLGAAAVRTIVSYSVSVGIIVLIAALIPAYIYFTSRYVISINLKDETISWGRNKALKTHTVKFRNVDKIILSDFNTLLRKNRFQHVGEIKPRDNLDLIMKNGVVSSILQMPDSYKYKIGEIAKMISETTGIELEEGKRSTTDINPGQMKSNN